MGLKTNIIHDKHGRRYFVSSTDDDLETFRRFNIEYRGRRIGYCNYHFESDDVLFIDDLHIDDKAMRPPWLFVDLIFWHGSLPPEKWRITNYQKRGLGTAMIKFLASYARSNSAKRIEGEVKYHDYKENSDLPDWYRRRGFAVNTDKDLKGCVAKISLTI